MKLSTTLIIFILSFPYCSALPIGDSKTGHDTRNPIELTELTVIGNKPATHFRLACETVFDRKDLRRPGYDFSTNHSAGNYFRSITAECDPKLCAEIKALLEQDSKLAYNIAESYNDGRDHIILNIANNDETINVGFWWTEEGTFRLFIQGTPEAFQ